MPVPGTSSNGLAGTEALEPVEVTTTGTLHVVSIEDGLWFIEGDDGQIYSSPTELAPELFEDGARVVFVGLFLPTISDDGSTVVEILAIEILVDSGG